MALPRPKVQTKTFVSLNGETRYEIRPFTIREQKILLVAKESMKNEPDQKKGVEILLDALEQVFSLCILNVDAKDIPEYDFPFLMLEIRKLSVDNESILNYRCKSTMDNGEECGNEFQIKINLDKIETKGKMKFKRDDRIIQVDDNIGVCMKYPSFKNFKKIYSEEVDDIQAFRLYMEYVYDMEGNIYPISETSDEELEEFIVDLGPKIQLIQDWIMEIPKPYYHIKYTCKKCGSEKNIELKEINDFF